MAMVMATGRRWPADSLPARRRWTSALLRPGWTSILAARGMLAGLLHRRPLEQPDGLGGALAITDAHRGATLHRRRCGPMDLCLASAGPGLSRHSRGARVCRRSIRHVRSKAAAQRPTGG